MNIYEHHEVLGRFFLPEDKDDPEKWVPGVLEWDPSDGGRATVELIGGFLPADATENNMLKRTIYLETVRGEKYSVWDAVSTNSLSNGTKTYEEHWYSNQIYFGDHILPTDASFTKATFELDELYYLLGKMQQLEKEDGTLELHYKVPAVDDCQTGIFEGITKNAHYSIDTLSSERSTYHRCGLVHTSFVSANVNIALRNNENGAETASNYIKELVPIHDLVRLAAFQPCGVAKVELRQKNNGGGYLLKNLGVVTQPYKHHEIQDIVFTLNDISLESFLEKRASLIEKEEALDSWIILVGLCGYSSNFREEYTNQCFFAAEGFYKFCLKRGKSNLRGQLQDLYSLLPQEIQDQINFDASNWAKLAKKIRNRVAHGGPAGRNDFTTSPSRYAVAKSVHLVTYLVLLKELGVPSEKVCNALKYHSGLSWMMHYCDEVRLMLES